MADSVGREASGARSQAFGRSVRKNPHVQALSAPVPNRRHTVDGGRGESPPGDPPGSSLRATLLASSADQLASATTPSRAPNTMSSIADSGPLQPATATTPRAINLSLLADGMQRPSSPGVAAPGRLAQSSAGSSPSGNGAPPASSFLGTQQAAQLAANIPPYWQTPSLLQPSASTSRTDGLFQRQLSSGSFGGQDLRRLPSPKPGADSGGGGPLQLRPMPASYSPSNDVLHRQPSRKASFNHGQQLQPLVRQSVSDGHQTHQLLGLSTDAALAVSGLSGQPSERELPSSLPSEGQRQLLHHSKSSDVYGATSPRASHHLLLPNSASSRTIGGGPHPPLLAEESSMRSILATEALLRRSQTTVSGGLPRPAGLRGDHAPFGGGGLSASAQPTPLADSWLEKLSRRKQTAGHAV